MLLNIYIKYKWKAQHEQWSYNFILWNIVITVKPYVVRRVPRIWKLASDYRVIFSSTVIQKIGILR